MHHTPNPARAIAAVSHMLSDTIDPAELGHMLRKATMQLVLLSLQSPVPSGIDNNELAEQLHYLTQLADKLES